MRYAVIIAALCAATPTLSAEWAMRAGDEPFSQSALATFLTTEEIRFHDGGRSEYGPGQAYAYVYSSEDRAEGHYRIEADGSVCVDFVNGFARCDLYVQNGTRVLLIDEKGDRYPLR
ncbi:MAG: hypothetical protein WBC95_01860 [Albidovulum sp.]